MVESGNVVGNIRIKFESNDNTFKFKTILSG